jgi:hypothetical protein
LADAVMAALGSRFHSLSEEDVCILADLYTATPSAAGAMAEAVEEPEGSLTLAEREQCPSTPPNEAGGDEAAGSPAVSINAAPGDKGAISSPEDESSEDESPRGEGHAVSVELPIDVSLPKWRTISQRLRGQRGGGRRLTSLARRLTRMSLGQEPEVPANGPVDSQGPPSLSFA